MGDQEDVSTIPSGRQIMQRRGFLIWERPLYVSFTEVGRWLCNLRRPTLHLLSFVLFLLTFTFFLVPLVFIFILRETCQRRKEYIQTMYVSSTLRHAYTIENLRSFFFCWNKFSEFCRDAKMLRPLNIFKLDQVYSTLIHTTPQEKFSRG